MPNKIIYVKRKIGNGYIGMNYPASKKLKISHNGKNTFYVYQKMPKDKIDRTIRHEEIEEHLMRKKGLSYNKAHQISNLIEDNNDLQVIVRGSNNRRGTIRRRI